MVIIHALGLQNNKLGAWNNNLYVSSYIYIYTDMHSENSTYQIYLLDIQQIILRGQGVQILKLDSWYKKCFHNYVHANKCHYKSSLLKWVKINLF